LFDPSYRRKLKQRKKQMQNLEEEMHAFLKMKQASRKTKNNNRKCEKHKQSQHNYEQIKGIEMIRRRQLQNKKHTLK